MYAALIFFQKKSRPSIRIATYTLCLWRVYFPHEKKIVFTFKANAVSLPLLFVEQLQCCVFVLFISLFKCGISLVTWKAKKKHREDDFDAFLWHFERFCVPHFHLRFISNRICFLCELFVFTYCFSSWSQSLSVSTVFFYL